jgi:hypothetical protein
MESAKHKVLSQREKVNEKFRHVSLEMETSTHFPMLIKAVQSTTGPILEMGSGLFSTPLLHWLCSPTKRSLTTCESYAHYLEFADKFKTEWHKTMFVKPQEQPKFESKFSVVFIDHSPKRPRTRGDDALMFKDSADLIVLHDAGENPYEKYGYAPIYKHFKYVTHWTGCLPHTTVLSNTIDVTSWN